jgi:Tfp pilus assembly protein PilO
VKDNAPTTAAHAPFPWHAAALAAAACVGLTLGAYAIGVRPMLDERARERTQRETLKGQRGRASDLAATVADLQHQLHDAKSVLARSPVRLQPAALVNQRLEALARLAGECRVQLDEMRPGVPVDSTHYQTVPIRIVGTGRYPDYAMFLRKLRGTFGDMGVRSFNATNLGGGQPELPVAAFQAELVWFTELPRK